MVWLLLHQRGGKTWELGECFWNVFDCELLFSSNWNHHTLFVQKMLKTCLWKLFLSWFQVSGVIVSGSSAVLMGSSQGRYGASTPRAGQPTTATVSTWTNQKVSGSASRSVTGTRTCSSGTCQTGGAVLLSLSLETNQPRGQLTALQPNMASRDEASAAYAPQTPPRCPPEYVNSFPRNLWWSRPVSSPVHRIA